MTRGGSPTARRAGALCEIRTDGSFEGFRREARLLLAAGVEPARVAWLEGSATGLLPGLAAAPGAPAGTRPRGAVEAAPPRVPPAFSPLARRAACHRAPDRFALLYRVVWRLARGDRGALSPGDEDGQLLLTMARAVRQDVHRFQALVRFGNVVDAGGERWVAYHAPDHRTLALAAPFFARRFAAMRWSLLTPDRSAHWDGTSISFGAGVPRPQGGAGAAAGTEDGVEALWRRYYASTFDPARVNPRLLQRHLPERFRAGLPEAREIARLVRGARGGSSRDG